MNRDLKALQREIEHLQYAIATATGMASDALRRHTHISIVIKDEPPYCGTTEEVVQKMGRRIIELRMENEHLKRDQIQPSAELQ